MNRAAASPVEGHFRTLPEASTVDAFLSMSTNRVLNRQVRHFIRNGEDGSVLEVLNQIVANSHAARARRGTKVSRTPSGRLLGRRTPGIPESREGAGVDRGETRIETEEEMIVGIIAVMNRSIGTEIGGETIAGGPRGSVTGTVRGADVTGGDVMMPIG